MIPNNVRSADLKGKQLRTTKDILNGAGIVIPKGTIVTVSKVSRGFTIKTEPCEHCGLYAIVRGVTRSEVELL